MSSSDPRETDCSDALDHLYEYLDQEMPEADRDKLAEHLDECSPCLDHYGLEQAVKKLVKRCCGQDDVPSDLRSKVMGRIELIRAGEAVPDEAVIDLDGYSHPGAEQGAAEEEEDVSSSPRRKNTL